LRIDPPHPDYRQARLLLAGIDPALCTDTFTFGKDGKPFYISGPHDSPEKFKIITHKLSLASGKSAVVGKELAHILNVSSDDTADEEEPA
jgi:hypothetical protein